MITFLDGTLASALPTQASVNVGGVGYEVLIPLSSYDKLPVVGQPVHILTQSATVRRIVNMTALTVVDCAVQRQAALI